MLGQRVAPAFVIRANGGQPFNDPVNADHLNIAPEQSLNLSHIRLADCDEYDAFHTLRAQYVKMSRLLLA